MLPLLTASNILRTDDNGDIMYNNPGMESTLAYISFEPRENECITVDELLTIFCAPVLKQINIATRILFLTWPRLPRLCLTEGN